MIYIKKIIASILIYSIITSVMAQDAGSTVIVNTISAFEKAESMFEKIQEKKEALEEQLKNAKKIREKVWWADNAYKVYSLIKLLDQIRCLTIELDDVYNRRSQAFTYSSCYYSIRKEVTVLSIKSQLVTLNSILQNFSDETTPSEKSDVLNKATDSVRKTVNDTQEEIVSVKDELDRRELRNKSMDDAYNLFLIQVANANNEMVVNLNLDEEY